MIYTDEVRKKLDAILKAFGEYIDGQNYFDIVYSKKIGYVWILAECPGDAGAVLLDTPEKMLDQLFNEVINDVVNADENKTHILNALTLSEWEECCDSVYWDYFLVPREKLAKFLFCLHN